METNKRRVISLLVDNQSGVLARVSSLFCRRGFNIDSLTVSATNDPAVSRITVTITSDEKALSQLILQTERLEVTRQVFVLDGEKSLERELLLLKVASDVHNRSELREIASIYKAKIILSDYHKPLFRPIPIQRLLRCSCPQLSSGADLQASARQRAYRLY